MTRPWFRLFPSVLVILAALMGAPSVYALSETHPALENGPEEAADPKDPCGPVNFYERPTDPIAEIPIYQQGETDLCYAYTAAQLTEYYLRKNGSWKTDDHINPLWIAIAYKGGRSKGIRIKNNELGHGFFHTAFVDMADLGICSPDVFEKALFDFKTKFAANHKPRSPRSKFDLPVLSDPDFFYLFEAIWDQRARSDRFYTPKTRDEFREYLSAIKQLSLRPDFRRISQRAFGHIFASHRTDGTTISDRAMSAQKILQRELRQIHEIVLDVPETWVAKRKKIRYLRDVVFQACTGDALMKPELPEVKSMGLGWASNRRLKAGIDRMLDAVDPQPVGIGYCAKFYSANDTKAKKGARRNGLLPRGLKAINKNCAPHYSMIVGRRKSPTNGSCQYLVRNTYGRDFWTKRYECLCEKTDGTGFEKCRHTDAVPKSDRVVGCWVDQKPMLNALYDVSVLGKKGFEALSEKNE